MQMKQQQIMQQQLLEEVGQKTKHAFSPSSSIHFLDFSISVWIASKYLQSWFVIVKIFYVAALPEEPCTSPLPTREADICFSPGALLLTFSYLFILVHICSYFFIHCHTFSYFFIHFHTATPWPGLRSDN